MRVLIVCSYKEKGINHTTPFISEQVSALNKIGIETDFFYIKRKGISGYLSELKNLKKKVNEYNPNLIHAHFGLSGLLANLQRKIPVVTTYHGSDINNKTILILSKLSIKLSAYNIFVSKKNIDLAKPQKNYALLPCGVDTDLFDVKNYKEARIRLEFKEDDNIILFSGAFDNKVKNYSLAKSAVDQLSKVKFIEMKGFSRTDVAWLMNAADVILMTSFTEGSPQVIKEALSCGLPVVSVPVGDVPELISKLDGCFVTNYEADEIASKLKDVLKKKMKLDSHNFIVSKFDNKKIANELKNIYDKILS